MEKVNKEQGGVVCVELAFQMQTYCAIIIILLSLFFTFQFYVSLKHEHCNHAEVNRSNYIGNYNLSTFYFYFPLDCNSEFDAIEIEFSINESSNEFLVVVFFSSVTKSV